MKRNPPVPRFGVSSSSGEDSWIECVWADSASSVKIFRFKILELLGEGGFCQCYKVLESETGRIFALKVFLKDKLVGDMKAKFLSEIKIHKSMIHPHIVRFEAVLKDSACYYVLMEMCHYSSMDALIKRRKRLREPECQYYLLQVLSALRYMHSHLVIHRDIKLANLFLQNGLMVKIGDFGLSTRLTHALERKLSFCGTPNYLAPEIFDRKEGHSFEVDIWALGCILYTMLFGRPPFASNSIDSVYRKIHSSDVIFPEESQVSDVAKDLILKILQNNPCMYSCRSIACLLD